MGCYDFTILILYIGKSLLIGGGFILFLEVYSRHKKDVHTITYTHQLINTSLIKSNFNQYKTPSIRHLHMIHLHILFAFFVCLLLQIPYVCTP